MERVWAAFWELSGRRVAVFKGLKKALKKVQRQKPRGGLDKGSGRGRVTVNGCTWISGAQPGEEFKEG